MPSTCLITTVTDQALDFTFVVRMLSSGKICAHSLNAISKLMHHLIELEHHHDDANREAN
jgi:hypothetical protein